MPTVTQRAARLALASLFTALLAACSGGGSAEPEAPPPAPPPPPPANRAPVAAFSVSATSVAAGSPLAFDASTSSDADGDPLIYSWDFGDGTRGGGATIAHLYANAGSYTATLTVADGRGGVTRSTRALTANAVAAPGPSVTVHGAVGDMSGALAGVTVQQVGGSTAATTASDGTVSLSLATGTPLLLRLSKAGYAEQFIPLHMPLGATTAEFKAGLLPREAPVAFNADTGGTLAGKHGASLALEAGALVDANGAPASGTVQVSITPLDIRGGGAAQFPGAFDGVLPNGQTVPILSYGTVEYQLSANGQRLQLAPGKTASIDLPVYANRNLGGSAVTVGQTIPLWSLDESTGHWVQEGQGTVVASAASPTGLALHGRVAHMSWWNGDFPLLPPYPYTANVTCVLRTLPANTITPVPCSVAPPLPKDFSAVQSSDNFQPQSLQRFEVAASGAAVTLPIGVPIDFFACTRQTNLICGSKTIAGDPAVDSTVVIELTQTQLNTCSNPQSISAPLSSGIALQALEIRCFNVVASASQVLRVGVSADQPNTVSGKKRLKDANGTVLAEANWSSTRPDVIPLRLPLAAGNYVLEVENTGFNTGAATLDLSLVAPIAVTVPSITPVTLISQDSQAFTFTPVPGTLLLATANGLRPELASSLNGVTDTSVSLWATLMLQPTTAAPVSVQLTNGYGTNAFRFKLAAPPRLLAGTPQDASITDASDLLVKQFVYDAAGGETIALQARMPSGFAGNNPVSLGIFDASGAELEPASTVNSVFRNDNNLVAITLPAAGPYRIDLTSKYGPPVPGGTAGLSVLPAPVPFTLSGESASVSSSIDTLAAARGHQVALARGDLIRVDVDPGTGPTRLRPVVYLRQLQSTGSPYRAPALSQRDSFGFLHPGYPLSIPTLSNGHSLSGVVAVPADGNYLLHLLGGAAGSSGSVGGATVDGTTGPYTLMVRRPAPSAPLAPNTAQSVTVPALSFANVTVNIGTAGAYLLCTAGGGGAVYTQLYDSTGVELQSAVVNGRVAWNLTPGNYHWAVSTAGATVSTSVTTLWQAATDPVAPTLTCN